MANYLIAIGGTGSRCLEAFTYLVAAGLFRDRIQVLIVDPDISNGNAAKLRQLLADYDKLHLAKQPDNPTYRGWFKGEAPAPTLFQAAINRPPTGGEQYPVFWNNQNDADRKFKHVIHYSDQADSFKRFLDLFYDPDDREMPLNVGYQGRTNVGAVALKQDLEETATVKGSGFSELVDRLYLDLQQDEQTKVFIMGSVFGGTGAAGIPTIPSLIGNLDGKTLPEEQRERLRYGCAMIGPYFAFPKNEDANVVLGPGADSSQHVVATQAALLHYAHVPPGYEHVYLIGSPGRPQTNDKNRPGGEDQKNAPHYVELAAALAAWDFFGFADIAATSRELHFADTMNQDRQDVGVTWQTLPVNPKKQLDRRNQVKRDLVIFTTLAYFYKYLLYNDIIGAGEYVDSIWYKDNFAGFPLDDHSQTTILTFLESFCTCFLEWLCQVGETSMHGGTETGDGRTILRLFNWQALPAGRLETDHPAHARRHPNRASAVVAVGNRNEAAADRRGGTTARTACRPVGVPGVAGRAPRVGFGRGVDAHLRCVALADQHEPGSAHPLHEVRVHVRTEPGRLDPLDAAGVQVSLGNHREVLDDVGDATERAVRNSGLGSRSLVERNDHGVERGVHGLDALDRRLDQLGRRDLAVANELGLLGCIVEWIDRLGHMTNYTDACIHRSSGPQRKPRIR
jgi:hypothetical protein